MVKKNHFVIKSEFENQLERENVQNCLFLTIEEIRKLSAAAETKTKKKNIKITNQTLTAVPNVKHFRNNSYSDTTPQSINFLSFKKTEKRKKLTFD